MGLPSSKIIFIVITVICILFFVAQDYYTIEYDTTTRIPFKIKSVVPPPKGNVDTLQLIKLQKMELKQLKSKIKMLSAKLVKEVEGINSTQNSNELKAFNYGLHTCDMETCFNYSMCPVTNQFKIYVYPEIYNFYTKEKQKNISNSLIASLHAALSNNHQVTKNPTEACVFIALLNSSDFSKCVNETTEVANENISLQHFRPEKLEHWSNDGTNHLIWFICDSCNRDLDSKKLLNFGKAMIVSKMYRKSEFRPHFDVVEGHINDAIKSKPKNNTPVNETYYLPSLTPAKRKYLASFSQSETSLVPSIEMALISSSFEREPSPFLFLRTPKLESVTANLEQKSKRSTSKSPQNNPPNNPEILLQSTFSLIMLEVSESDEETVLTNNRLQRQLFEMLQSGTIPVVLGSQFQFPFSEFIDWSKVALTFPLGRMSELPFILKSVSDSDILTLRLNGRRVFVKYMSSIDSVVETLLAGVRTRIGVPPMPYDEIPSPSLYPDSSRPDDSSFNLTAGKAKVKNITDVLGPLQSPFPSPKFKRNVTSSLFLDKYELWNVHYQPFRLLPSTPWDISVPSEAQVNVSSFVKNKTLVGVRPTFGGMGDNATTFYSSLGGNSPPEQFTVVMLTYKREIILMDSLKHLVGLPYLNSVVVVWNTPNYPLDNLTWPEIGVPIHLIKAEKNSLNNRFLPYNVIETDAILSLDDDLALSNEEIVFAFRVWRENRDRLVGFPGRFHKWDVGSSVWRYEAHNACEFSMVLTGAAFFHKYYMYMYTFEMPAVIREEVDRLMNCEDIAMNFLVSYFSKKTSIKITSKAQFPCSKCKSTLSSTSGHYTKRDSCINTFIKVYGYTTLMYTQYRVDSMNFGTSRNPQCFRSVK